MGKKTGEQRSLFLRLALSSGAFVSCYCYGVVVFVNFDWNRVWFGLRGTNSCLFVVTNTTTTIINGRSRILPKVYFLKSLPRGGGTAEEFLGFMA